MMREFRNDDDLLRLSVLSVAFPALCILPLYTLRIRGGTFSWPNLAFFRLSNNQRLYQFEWRKMEQRSGNTYGARHAAPTASIVLNNTSIGPLLARTANSGT